MGENSGGRPRPSGQARSWMLSSGQAISVRRGKSGKSRRRLCTARDNLEKVAERHSSQGIGLMPEGVPRRLCAIMRSCPTEPKELR